MRRLLFVFILIIQGIYPALSTVGLCHSSLLIADGKAIAPQTTYIDSSSQDTPAFKHLQEALNTALAQNNNKLICRAYLDIASYYNQHGETRAAISQLQRAVHLAKENNLDEELGDAYLQLGKLFNTLGLFGQSLTYLFSALKVETLYNTTEKAVLFNLIGDVYKKTSDFENALSYFNQALHISDSLKDLAKVALNIKDIGVIKQKQGNFENAIVLYQKALPLARQANERKLEGVITGNIGSTMVEQGKLEEGLDYLNKALAIKETINVHRSILHTLNDISDVKIKLKDGLGAKEVAQRVIHLANDYAESNQLRFGYLNLSKSYKLLGDYENAYKYLDKYKAINDSLYSIEKARQINELQIQYEGEKKDNEINSLKQQKELAITQRRNYFLIGAIILLLLAILFFNQRLKNRRNQQLLEKEKEVDRIKTSFFTNISHEFRTPLSLILGPIESLKDEIENQKQQYQLELMKKSASRLLRLINQILDLSKLEANALEIKVKELNVADTIKGVAGSFQTIAETKDIRLRIECPEEEIILFANQPHIETICINLISNAFKFTESGGQIDVHLNKVKTSGNGQVVLKVIDTGAGISAEQVGNIFNRFYQAGSAKTNQFGGTGIGLALTKELVEAHGGTIIVESELNVGTTVTVTFLPGKGHFTEEQLQPEPSGEQTGYPSTFHEHVVLEKQGSGFDKTKKPLVLVVEDNEDVRNYIISIIKTKYAVSEAKNGEEGVAKAIDTIPDLVLSDVMMPKMNGYEVSRAIKQDKKTSHIPVILLTAKASVKSRIAGLETEADVYLSKPFVPKELLLCIHNLIQSRKKLRQRYNHKVVLKPADIAVNSMDEVFLTQLMEIVEKNYSNEAFSVEQLSKDMGMSRSQMHRKLHALTNESASQFIRSFRLQRAMEMLKKATGQVSEIAYKVGFSSHAYFDKCFTQHYNCTPTDVLKQPENYK